MKSLNLQQFQELSDMFNSMQQNMSQDGPGAKYERSYSRLQNALTQYNNNPLDETKSKALQNAMRSHQTACQSFLVKAQTTLAQAKHHGIKLKSTDALDELSQLLSKQISPVRAH